MILTNLDALDRATRKRVKYLRQRASITGMGNKSFDDAAVNLAKIQAIFKRTIGNQLEEGPVYSDFTGLSTPLIDTSHQETIKVTTRAYFWEMKLTHTVFFCKQLEVPMSIQQTTRYITMRNI